MHTPTFNILHMPYASIIISIDNYGNIFLTYQ